MEVAEFSKIAMQSAQRYYDLVAEAGGGVSIVNVKSVTTLNSDGFFALILEKKLPAAAVSSIDSLIFSINGTHYASGDIRPIEYDSDALKMIIHPQDRFTHLFDKSSQNSIFIISDLKFLIKRVQNWYVSHGSSLSVPAKRTFTDNFIFCKEPSDEQYAAVRGALNNGLSYIWGAPGTGKTRVVLASCVLTLLKQRKKVLLLAPTNNALEQMLYGVIPAITDAGHPAATVLRLGIPSTRFASKYYSSCEPSGFSHQSEAVTDELKNIRRCLNFRAKLNHFRDVQASITTGLNELETYHSAIESKNSELEALRLSVVQYRAQELLIRNSMEQLLSAIKAAKARCSGPTAYLRKIFYKQSYEKDLSDIEHSTAELSLLNDKLDNLAKVISSSNASEDAMQSELSSLYTDFADSLQQLINAASINSDLYAAAKSITETHPQDGISAVKGLFTSFEQQYAQSATHYKKYKSYTDEQLKDSAEVLASQLDELSVSMNDRLSKCYVLAMTIDKFLAYEFDRNSFYPAHVFLDEAGYCSLIKGASAFSLGVPITFLGDHMQLPPIFELDESAMLAPDTAFLSLWAQSAVHAESIFSDSIEKIRDDYLYGNSAPFRLMSKYDLNATYRFGNELASVLADYVYSPLFHSAQAESMEIIVLDAPHLKQCKDRTSKDEVNAIKEYLQSTHIDNFAILTPYRNQVKLLSEQLPAAAKDERILTIHAAQGREWDTVFFSVVDTADMFFTNALLPKSKGKQVINTAISRAKRRLVIVCDKTFWERHPKQLICKLIQSATSPSE